MPLRQVSVREALEPFKHLGRTATLKQGSIKQFNAPLSMEKEIYYQR
jgi:hypothetical protein